MIHKKDIFRNLYYFVLQKFSFLCKYNISADKYISSIFHFMCILYYISFYYVLQ